MNVRMQHIAIKHHVKKKKEKRTASAIFISRDVSCKKFKVFKISSINDYFAFEGEIFGNAVQKNCIFNSTLSC